MRKRLYLGILALLIIASLLIYNFSSPIVIEGIVDHKAVTGVKGDTSYTILLNRPAENGSWIIVKDKDYEMFFLKKEKNALISESVEDEMKKKYSDIKYLVSIRLDSRDPINGIGKGDTLAYFVSRDEFNRVRIGDKVKFEVSREKCTIRRILQIERTALVGGLFIAFREEITKDEILSLLDECNIQSSYIKGVDYMSHYYAIVPGDKLKEIEFLHNDGFKELNTTLYYSDEDILKKDRGYVIFFEGEASLDDAKQILNPYDIKIKEINWNYVRFLEPVSEEIAKEWKNKLEVESDVLRVILDCYYDTSYEDKNNHGRLYPETVEYTYFDDYKLINNTDSFLIKTYKPLTEEQIKILRNSGVRKLSASEIETVYHSLIEENRVEEVKDLDFIEDVYQYKTK
ncbi:MAG: hypothetical protein PWP01_1143 [Methanosarcinales archaeon]|nr:hypothetical protein [Methanosarcinales archaeon]